MQRIENNVIADQIRAFLLQMGHLFCYRSIQSLRLVYLVFYALEADAMGAVLRGVH